MIGNMKIAKLLPSIYFFCKKWYTYQDGAGLKKLFIKIKAYKTSDAVLRAETQIKIFSN